MPRSPQVTPVVLAMDAEFLRTDNGESFKRVPEGLDKPKTIQAELEAVLSGNHLLEEELLEAGSWAQEMHGIWGKAESHWQEKAQELQERIEAAQKDSDDNKEAEEPAKKVTDFVDRLRDVDILAEDAERKAEKAEGKASESRNLLEELNIAIQEAEESFKNAEDVTELLKSRRTRLISKMRHCELKQHRKRCRWPPFGPMRLMPSMKSNSRKRQKS